jgi:N-acetylmuramoyl-L-alanine amidase
MLKILLDPGHGGSETGAVFNDYTEKDLNLQLALLLRPELERCGITVAMTRDADIAVSLYDRGMMAKSLACNALISIHFNADDEESSGPEIWYSFLPQVSESSRWIAECIFNETIKLGGVSSRGVKTYESTTYSGHNYYGVLRNAEPIAGVICEGLFLDNASDVERLKEPDFLKNLAIAYAKGICSAYGITYVPDHDVKEASILKPVFPFKDWDTISEYAQESVRKLKDLGVFVGDKEGNFNPKNPITREDLATVLVKILNLGGK